MFNDRYQRVNEYYNINILQKYIKIIETKDKAKLYYLVKAYGLLLSTQS